ncbi:MAG: T9SS type A sorting domain-containing protein [Bacteroidales bacterium]
MFKKLSAVILSFFLMTSGYAQIDTCPINPYIQGNYVDDAYVLVGRMLEDPLHPYHDSIDIPSALLKKPLAALSAAFEVNCPEKDTVFDIYNIHVRGAGMGMLGRLIIWVDTNYAWVQQLIDDGTYSGNPAYDSLIANRGFTILYVFSFSPIIVVVSPGSYNLGALINKLITIPGVVQASPDGLAGDGSDIKYYSGDNTDSLVFDLGWGDCPSGCIHHRFWNFKVNSDCSGSYQYAYGDPIPQAVDIIEPYDDNKISPNPFSESLKIETPGTPVRTIEFYSLTGKLMKYLQTESENINLSDLENGCYLIRVLNPQGKALIKKIIVKASAF